MIEVIWRIEVPGLGWVRFFGTYNEVFAEASKEARRYNRVVNVVSTEYYASPQNFSVSPSARDYAVTQ
jgi:hypothetical protein